MAYNGQNSYNNNYQKNNNRSYNNAPAVTIDEMKTYFNSPDVLAIIQRTLGVSSNNIVVSIINLVIKQNLDVTPASLLNVVLQSYQLNLPVTSDLGLAYVVPFFNKKKQCKEASLQIGYRGYIQLALRSNQYRRLSAVEVTEFDTDATVFQRLNGIIPAEKKGNIIGYVAYLELLNGFVHSEYMSIQDIKAHRDKYDKNNNPLWNTEYNAMALKTVMKRLLKGSAPVSLQLVEIMSMDEQSSIGENNNFSGITLNSNATPMANNQFTENNSLAVYENIQPASYQEVNYETQKAIPQGNTNWNGGFDNANQTVTPNNYNSYSPPANPEPINNQPNQYTNASPYNSNTQNTNQTGVLNVSDQDMPEILQYANSVTKDVLLSQYNFNHNQLMQVEAFYAKANTLNK